MNNNLDSIRLISALLCFLSLTAIVLIAKDANGAPGSEAIPPITLVIAASIAVFRLAGKQKTQDEEKLEADSEEKVRNLNRQQEIDHVAQIMKRWHEILHSPTMETYIKVHHLAPSRRGDRTVVCCCIIGEPQANGATLYTGIIAEANMPASFVTKAVAVEEGFVSLCDGALAIAALSGEPLLDVVTARYRQQVIHEFMDIPAHKQNPLIPNPSKST